MKNTTVIGREGEDRAVEFLEKQGIEIHSRNYHSRYGEIDIIAIENDILAFIEVKTRKSTDFGTASEYVTPKKQQKIIKTATLFLMETDLDLQPRFDIIEVYKTKINYIKNAYECM
ncbi:MAG: YraN family protein [Clostridia bacterium]